jgi:CRISPR-associated protein Cas2
MVVMILEKVPQALRGELTRWLLEIKTGIYIGHVTGMVREKLWEKCSEERKAGWVFQGWSTNTEQHFKMRLCGVSGREIVDWEGLQLVKEVKDELSEVQKRRTRQAN